MRILCTNDDGIGAPGIAALVEVMQTLGDVTVVAPDRQQSAVGHALTVASPLRATEYRRKGQVFGWAINGTPADCVKLAVTSLLDERPDLVVSGINHGSNTSVNAIYSGTVSAATEGTLMGIPSMAVSLDSWSHEADMTLAAEIALEVATMIPVIDMPTGTLLNVNVPNVPRAHYKGLRITRQGHSVWQDSYERRRDPHGQEYFWLTGKLMPITELDDADDLAVRDGYVAVTPLHYELTNFDYFDILRSKVAQPEKHRA
jgi:5'-nucleotidase